MIDWDYFRNIDFSYTGISAFITTLTLICFLSSFFYIFLCKPILEQVRF